MKSSSSQSVALNVDASLTFIPVHWVRVDNSDIFTVYDLTSFGDSLTADVCFCAFTDPLFSWLLILLSSFQPPSITRNVIHSQHLFMQQLFAAALLEYLGDRVANAYANCSDINYRHTCPSERFLTSNEQASVLTCLCLIGLLISWSAGSEINAVIIRRTSQIIFLSSGKFCSENCFFSITTQETHLIKMASLLLLNSQGGSYATPLTAVSLCVCLLTQMTEGTISKTCQLREFISFLLRCLL